MTIGISDAESDSWDSWSNYPIDFSPVKDTSTKEEEEDFSAELEASSAGWDRTLLQLSSYAAAPLCEAFRYIRFETVKPLDPTKFNNYDSLFMEMVKRTCIIGAAAIAAIYAATTIPLALFLGISSKILKAVAFSLQKNEYTHVRLKGKETKLNGELKIGTLNVCGVCGGMHYDHGGVNEWSTRIDEIVKKIEEENLDVLILQEIYDTAFAEALIQKLEHHYAHAFTQLGANVMGSIGGVMVFTKCAIHRFTNIPFENNDWTLTRTFTTLEVKDRPGGSPCARIIGTHLTYNDDEKSLAQFAQIIENLRKATLYLPTFIAGDFNLERDVPEQGGMLTPYLIHGYQGTAPTCTNKLVEQWDGQARGVEGEIIDYISEFRETDGLPVVEKGVEMKNPHFIETYDEMTYDTRTALSDHKGFVLTVQYVKVSAPRPNKNLWTGTGG